jgi:sugar/nucleoside kinase (ribokinase family)
MIQIHKWCGQSFNHFPFTILDLVAETSNPVTSTRSIGGVARNIAENLGRLGETVALVWTIV